jgi:NAD(P)H-flavin reductase
MSSKIFTREEVARHNTVTDCYTIVGNSVYDITTYLNDHPGGYDLLFRNAGKDSTKDFEAMFHSMKARKILQKYHVGELDTNHAHSVTSLTPNYLTRFSSNNNLSTGYPQRSNLIVSTPKPSLPFSQQTRVMCNTLKTPIPTLSVSTNEATEEPVMNEKKFKKFKLIQVKNLTHDTKIYVFELPNGRRLNLQPGKHLQVCVVAKQEDNKPPERIVRKYTPITDKEEYLELLIKCYEKGIVSKHIAAMQVGENLFMRGPFGSFEYTSNKFKKLGMIAAGTGITPMYQIMRSVYENPQDETEIKLLFANRTEDDILLKKELDMFISEKISVTYLLSKPKSHVEHVGHINERLISDYSYMGPDSMMLICGPDGFCNLAAQILRDMGHSKTLIHIF